MDTVSPQPGDLVLPLPAARPSSDGSGLPLNLLQGLWEDSKAGACGLTLDEFSHTLAAVGAKLNYGFPQGKPSDAAQQADFLRSLHLEELALASACALGREAAWQRFIGLYRAPLTQAAIAIAASATLGHDLADALYSELYGLREVDGERRSPLASYTGRGSLLGWLRITLAQRHVDHYRRTHREIPLETVDATAPEQASPPVPAELRHLADAVARTLQALDPEDRLLLSAYFLDRRTLLQIARILHVHEATVSRKLKKLVAHIREDLLKNLQSGGLSRRAAEKALGADPRDVEINLRSLLQTSQIASFSDQRQP